MERTKVQKNTMRIIELLKISAKILKLLSENDIRTSDYRYIDLYTDYTKMLKDGEKVAYIVAVLSKRYGTSESSVFRILRRFRKDVNL